MEKGHPNSIYEDYEADLQWKRTRRRHRFLTAFVILLALGMVGAAWYAYPILKRHDVTLTQIPQSLADVRNDVSSLGEQAKATDAKVEDWGTRQEELRGQLNKARGELMARIDTAKKQASDASAALIERARKRFRNSSRQHQNSIGQAGNFGRERPRANRAIAAGTRPGPEPDESTRPGTRIGAGPGDPERGCDESANYVREIHPAARPA